MPTVWFTIEHRVIDDEETAIGIWYYAGDEVRLRFRPDYEELREHYLQDLEMRRELDIDVDSAKFLGEVARQSTRGGTQRSLVAHEEGPDVEAIIDRVFRQHVERDA